MVESHRATIDIFGRVVQRCAQDPALVTEYEALKLQLAQDHGHDVAAYTGGKRAFVARVLASLGETIGSR